MSKGWAGAPLTAAETLQIGEAMVERGGYDSPDVIGRCCEACRRARAELVKRIALRSAAGEQVGDER